MKLLIIIKINCNFYMVFEFSSGTPFFIWTNLVFPLKSFFEHAVAVMISSVLNVIDP